MFDHLNIYIPLLGVSLVATELVVVPSMRCISKPEQRKVFTAEEEVIVIVKSEAI